MTLAARYRVASGVLDRLAHALAARRLLAVAPAGVAGGELAAWPLPIGEWLAAWAGAVLARPRLAAVATLALGALAAYYAAGNLGVNTDTANMIAATVPWRQHFNEYRAAFPLRDRNLLIVVDAPTPARADEFAAALLRELRAQPERYRSPLLAGEGEFFERNGLLYLPTAQLAALTDRLAAVQPLIGLLAARFDGAAVLDVARRTLAADGGGDAAALGSFYEELARSVAGAADDETAPLAWDRLIAGRQRRRRRGASSRCSPRSTSAACSRPPPRSRTFARSPPGSTVRPASRPSRVRLTGSVAMEHEELLSVSRGAGLGALATLAHGRARALCGAALVAAARGVPRDAARRFGVDGRVRRASPSASSICCRSHSSCSTSAWAATT